MKDAAIGSGQMAHASHTPAPRAPKHTAGAAPACGKRPHRPEEGGGSVVGVSTRSVCPRIPSGSGVESQPRMGTRWAHDGSRAPSRAAAPAQQHGRARVGPRARAADEAEVAAVTTAEWVSTHTGAKVRLEGKPLDTSEYGATSSRRRLKLYCDASPDPRNPVWVRPRPNFPLHPFPFPRVESGHPLCQHTPPPVSPSLITQSLVTSCTDERIKEIEEACRGVIEAYLAGDGTFCGDQWKEAKQKMRDAAIGSGPTAHASHSPAPRAPKHTAGAAPACGKRLHRPEEEAGAVVGTVEGALEGSAKGAAEGAAEDEGRGGGRSGGEAAGAAAADAAAGAADGAVDGTADGAEELEGEKEELEAEELEAEELLEAVAEPADEEEDADAEEEAEEEAVDEEKKADADAGKEAKAAKKRVRQSTRLQVKGASEKDAYDLDPTERDSRVVKERKGSKVPTPASQFGKAFPSRICTLLGLSSGDFGTFPLVPLPTKLPTGDDSFRFTLELAQQFHSATSVSSLVLLPNSAVSVQSVCNPMLPHTSLSRHHPCLAPSLSRDFPSLCFFGAEYPPASLVQPFSVSRGTFYNVFPRPCEALIEGFMAAHFSEKNIIWMAFSPPGTGFCGQLVANILFEAKDWWRSEYGERQLPAAVATGIATPFFPRIAQEASQNRCFEMISHPVPSPKWRPKRPEGGDNVAWNGYTITQYSGSHDVTALIEAFVGVRKSLVAFSEEKGRPHALMSVNDTQTWLRILTLAKVWGGVFLIHPEPGATRTRMSFVEMISLIKPLFHSEELGDSHMVGSVVGSLCKGAMNCLNDAIANLKCVPPLYAASPGQSGATLGTNFFVQYATPTSHPHFTLMATLMPGRWPC